MTAVYITKTAKFLPNHPVSNEEMEQYLGMINNNPSKSKRIVLRNNGITNRYYAITKEGKATHTNAQMTALAVKALFPEGNATLKDVQLLSCGTSTPDQLMPSHGVMVHGCLPESDAIEVVSPSGVCCSGMHALKYAYMAVKSGEVNLAVATGSERVSRLLNADNFEEEAQKLAELEGNPYIGFEKEFLRWMLSDGAGAFLLSNKPNEIGLNLKIEWLEGVSYAHQQEACMYMASDKMDDGTLKSYMDFPPSSIIEKSIMSIKQDVKLLSQYIVSLGFDKLKGIFERRSLSVDQIDHFLPHLSSKFFQSKIAESLENNGMGIPQEKWFTNLSTVGNIGAGSIYLILDELYNSGSLKKGEKILVAVPESARFSYVFGLLTVC